MASTAIETSSLGDDEYECRLKKREGYLLLFFKQLLHPLIQRWHHQ